MPPARTLTLRREALTELTPAELTGVAAAGAEEGATAGRVCTGVMVASAVVTAVTQILLATRAPGEVAD